MKNHKIEKIIYFLIYIVSLCVLKFRFNGTIYSFIIFLVDSLFFFIMYIYISGIKMYFKSKNKKENNNNTKITKKHVSFSSLFNAAKKIGLKKVIIYILVFLLQIPTFIFIIYVAYRLNYKASINEFKEIVSSKCPLSNNNIYNLDNINDFLVTNKDTCEYEMGFIITTTEDKTVYPKMLELIKNGSGSFIPGRRYGLIDKEYIAVGMNHYKAIYKHGNSIVYVIAPYDKKNEVIEILQRLGYTSIPSFKIIFS